MEAMRAAEEEELMLSECSSGYESGWTVYLDESEGGPWDDNGAGCSKSGREEGQEEEDGMSTVSDASSGPPTLQGTDIFNASGGAPYYCSFSQCYELDSYSCRCALSSSYHHPPTACGGDQHGAKRRRVDRQQDKQRWLYHSFHDMLEDTATSPLPSCYAHACSVSQPPPLPSLTLLQNYQAKLRMRLQDPDAASAASGLPAADTNLDLTLACSSPTATRLKSQRRFSPEEHALSSTYMGRTNPRQKYQVQYTNSMLAPSYRNVLDKDADITSCGRGDPSVFKACCTWSQQEEQKGSFQCNC